MVIVRVRNGDGARNRETAKKTGPDRRTIFTLSGAGTFYDCRSEQGPRAQQGETL